MVVLPLSTTDSSCGTLHFTLTVIINSSSSKSCSSQREKVKRPPISTNCGNFDSFCEESLAQNSTYKSVKQPISISSLSKSDNTTHMLPEYLTNHKQSIQESRSFTLQKQSAIENDGGCRKHSTSKTSSKLHTPVYTRRKTSLEEELKMESEKMVSAVGKLQRFRRLSSTELETGCRNHFVDSSQHSRRSLRNTGSGTKPKSMQIKHANGESSKKENSVTHPGKGSLYQKKGKSKQNTLQNREDHRKSGFVKIQSSNDAMQKKILHNPVAPNETSLGAVSCKGNQISSTTPRKMSAPTIPFPVCKPNNNKVSNIKLDNKKHNTMQLQNLDSFHQNARIKAHSTLKDVSKTQITKNVNSFPMQQQVQRVSYILSVSSAASLQQSPRPRLVSKQPLKKAVNTTSNNEKGVSFATAVKRSGTDNKLDTQERLKTPSPNKRANTTLREEVTNEKEKDDNKECDLKGLMPSQSRTRTMVGSQINDGVRIKLGDIENKKDWSMLCTDQEMEEIGKSIDPDAPLAESEIRSTERQHVSIHPPQRCNLRLHPAVLRKSPQKAQNRNSRVTLAATENTKVLFRQSFPNSIKEQNLLISTEKSDAMANKPLPLRKQNTLAQITVVSVTGGSGIGEAIAEGDSIQSNSIPELTNLPINTTRNHPLRRQCAIQSSSSIDAGSMKNEGCSSSSNVFQLQNTLSIESVEGHIVHRRPRSLIHQSAGSLQGFSLFGSVDSEQSVPRTAPLATPEQELSLLEMASFENLPVDGFLQQGCVVHLGGNITLNADLRTSSIENKRNSEMENQQSLDAISNDVFFNTIPICQSVPMSVYNTEIQLTQVDNHIDYDLGEMEDDNKENEYQHDIKFSHDCKLTHSFKDENHGQISDTSEMKDVFIQGTNDKTKQTI